MSRTSRRKFLQTSAAAGLGYWTIGTPSARAFQSPNEKIRFACIGVGGKGSSDTDQVGELGDIVGLCDIDEGRLEDKAKRFSKAKKYFDFRKMLDEIGKSIDAVTVSTPDHTHAPASLMAMHMGKHVYCQKPLTHSVWEAREMAKVAREKKLATQMGNQGTAENGLRRAVEVIQSGAIGPVREIHVWTNRPVWPQAPKITARPKDTPDVPKSVHWDEFIGPAPMRHYHGTYHPFNWRGWWDFGTGALGDMGCHTANMAFMAAKLGSPTRVDAESGEVNPETYPAWATVKLQFPERGDLPPVKFFWYEGQRDGKKNLPPADKLYGETPPGSGSLIVGDKGTLYSPNDYGADYKMFPAKDFEGYKAPKETLARNGKGDSGMKQEWIAAMRGGPAPFSNFTYAGALTEAIVIGNIAIRIGKGFDWDGAKLQAVGCADAAQYVKREYRPGWFA